MLLAGEAGVHSVNRHAKCFPVTQDNYTKTLCTKKFLRTFGDQSYANPSTFGVLKSLIIHDNPWFLASTSLQHHQAQHKSSNMHKLLENKAEGHRGSLLGMLPPNGTTPQTAYRNFTQKAAIRAIQDWFDLNNDGRLRATHSSTDCNIQQYSNCQKSSSRKKCGLPCLEKEHQWDTGILTVCDHQWSWFFERIKQESSSIQNWTMLDPSPS